jgi:hypothetical protein
VAVLGSLHLGELAQVQIWPESRAQCAALRSWVSAQTCFLEVGSVLSVVEIV